MAKQWRLHSSEDGGTVFVDVLASALAIGCLLFAIMPRDTGAAAVILPTITVSIESTCYAPFADCIAGHPEREPSVSVKWRGTTVEFTDDCRRHVKRRAACATRTDSTWQRIIDVYVPSRRPSGLVLSVEQPFDKCFPLDNRCVSSGLQDLRMPAASGGVGSVGNGREICYWGVGDGSCVDAGWLGTSVTSRDQRVVITHKF